MEKSLDNISESLFYFTALINERITKGIKFELSVQEILKFIIENNYSATKFKYNRRKKINAQKTKVIVLDIDEPQINYLTIFDIKNKIKDLNHILATTRSHQILKMVLFVIVIESFYF